MDKTTKVTQAYRVAFRSLRTTDFEEEAFLAKNLLLRVTRKPVPSFAFGVSGIECSDLGFYSVPDWHSEIKIETGQKEFELDNYIELFTFSDEKDMDKIIADGSIKSQHILALIHLCLGERALDHKIVEDTQELELKYGQTEGVAKTEISYTCKCGMSSPIIRNEAAFPIVDLFPKGFKQLADSFEKYAKIDAPGQHRVNIALRWFYKSIKEKVIEDKFLALWISFETITMRGDTKLSLAKQFLSEMMKTPISNVESKLEIGKMFGYRSDLVHGKALDQQLLTSSCSKLQDIVEETLKYSIGLETQGKLLKYL